MSRFSANERFRAADALQVMGDDFDPMSQRPSKLLRISEAFDEWAGKLENRDSADVPYVARDYHELLVENLSLISALTNAIAASGPLVLFGCSEQTDSLPIRWEEVHSKGRDQCGEAWDAIEDTIYPAPDDQD